jgi:hypothetical protein
MSDIIGRLLDEAEKAQRKGHLLLAEVCRDASDQLGLITEERDAQRDAHAAAQNVLDAIYGERDRLREAQAAIHALSQRPPGGWLPGEHFQALNKIAALAAPKGTGHE